MKSVDKILTTTKDIGLKFVTENLGTVNLIPISDASFKTARGIKRELVYLIFIADHKGQENNVHFASNRF